MDSIERSTLTFEITSNRAVTLDAVDGVDPATVTIEARTGTTLRFRVAHPSIGEAVVRAFVSDSLNTPVQVVQLVGNVSARQIQSVPIYEWRRMNPMVRKRSFIYHVQRDAYGAPWERQGREFGAFAEPTDACSVPLMLCHRQVQVAGDTVTKFFLSTAANCEGLGVSGPLGYGCAVQVPNTVVLKRMYSPGADQHASTTSQARMNQYVDGGWRIEGPQGFFLP